MRTVSTLAAAGLALSASAQDHNHLTVNTDGSAISIVAGYLASETNFAFDAQGRLTHDGEIFVYHVEDLDAGLYFGETATLTSDFFAATGNLDGGDFRYEILAITPLDGGSATNALLGFSEHGSGHFDPAADFSALTRADRSFAVGFAGHPEDQAAAFNAPGLYDLTLVAWDANGLYADSSPISLRYNVIPAPASAAIMGLAGLAGVRRRR